ncbi:MAG: SBBP repeat-containing protein [Planctomycetota bacterium]
MSFGFVISSIALICLVLLFSAPSAYGKYPRIIWGKHISGRLGEGFDVAVDSKGHCILTGNFFKRFSIGSTVVDYNSPGAFIIKFDPQSNVIWRKKLLGTNDMHLTKATVDNEDNVFVTGIFKNSLDFEGTKLNSTDQFNIFIAKYDSMGRLVWVKKASGQTYFYPSGIAADNLGNVLVSGTFQEKIDFSGQILRSQPYSNVFLAKYDNDGNVIWTRLIDNARAKDIAITDRGSVVVVGDFHRELTFGSQIIRSTSVLSNADIFIAKYDTDGNPLWCQKAGDKSYDYGYDVASDESGNIYITGRISSDIFIAKYNRKGKLLWDRRFVSASFGWGSGITTDLKSNCFITGYFRGLIKTSGTSASINSRRKILFVSKYTRRGHQTWQMRLDSTDDCRGQSIASDDSGNIFVTGSFRGELDIGSEVFKSKDSFDVFLLCISDHNKQKPDSQAE